jgi:hypothetical protein
MNTPRLDDRVSSQSITACESSVSLGPCAAIVSAPPFTLSFQRYLDDQRDEDLSRIQELRHGVNLKCACYDVLVLARWHPS